MSGADDLRAFAADLGRVAGQAVPETDKVLKKGAQNIKEELQGQVNGSQWRGLAGAISYDPIGGVGSLGYEVGPDKSRRGGSLGNLWYFGGSRGGGYGDLEGPLANETPNLERELDRVVNDWGRQLE